ncbi:MULTISPECIES: glutathione S-transferase [unclassified Sphingomonas]|uniref:glutathione S-transferase family protein n=2 Tax=Sphingomonas TaxID=13687 RepID=UPI00226A2F7B|nr:MULTISPECIES: glutathione S-transferase [unclassified Sphingomonas]
MLTLHMLEYSRGLRIVWLLEALGTPYEVVTYQRDAEMHAPPALKAIHPLGKSPVIVDGDLTLAESATILRYLHDAYGDGRFAPAKGSNAHALHEEWLDYVESSAMQPMIIALMDRLRGGVGATMTGMADAAIPRSLEYIADGVGTKPFLMGDTPMLADIQMTYLFAIAERGGVLADHPRAAAYWQRLQDHPGFRRAVEVAGPIMPPSA